MKIDVSYLQKRFEAMSEEEFAATKKEDLVPEARAIYGQEAQRRSTPEWQAAHREVAEEWEKQDLPAENADVTFEREQIKIARHKRILGADEQVRGFVSLSNRSQIILGLPLLARFLLKKFLFVVTDQRVVLITVPAFRFQGGEFHQWIEHPLPCKLTLESTPKERHEMGNRVQLPGSLAKFVGRPFGFVLRGKAAGRLFKSRRVPNRKWQVHCPHPVERGYPRRPHNLANNLVPRHAAPRAGSIL